MAQHRVKGRYGAAAWIKVDIAQQLEKVDIAQQLGKRRYSSVA